MRIALAALLMMTTSIATANPFVEKLVPAVEAAVDVAGVTQALAAPPAGITVAHDAKATRWTITLATPLDSAIALKAWGWQRTHAVSGDVHQRTFSIRIATEVLSPDRIATRSPNAGRWTLRPILAARPAGKLPGLRAGASPAYPLPQYASQLARIEITARDHDDLVAALAAIKAPTMNDVTRELGPHDADVGSGLHVLEYRIGGKTIRVGTPDNVKVLYIIANGNDLYRAKP